MRGADQPLKAPITLFTLHSQENVNDFVAGSDKDMGGASVASLSLDDDGRAVFKGSLRSTVMTAQNRLGGYAAFRSRVSKIV